MNGVKEDLLKRTIAEIERHIIESALRRSNGNGREAAKQLGTTHRILMYRIRKYGINIESFKTVDPQKRKPCKRKRKG
ncbi:MAG: hypothetical protein N2572_00830 [Syntrophales bacterium]|nr:hypothetical protein [Syntrophales bacterium]